MPTIRPIPVPLDDWKPLTNAWVVNEKYCVYFEAEVVVGGGYAGLAFAPMEKGIGGRTIEPSFTDRFDYIGRTKVFRGGIKPTEDVIAIIEKWAEGHQ
jgi:hypothetical protein